MHETMERLYQVAGQLRDIEGQTRLAEALNESPQTVNNWESRGISAGGALKAQRELGCDAVWVLSGEGAPTVSLPLSLELRERVAILAAEDLQRLENVIRAHLGMPILNPNAPAPATPPRRFTAAPANQNVVPAQRATRKG